MSCPMGSCTLPKESRLNEGLRDAGVLPINSFQLIADANTEAVGSAQYKRYLDVLQLFEFATGWLKCGFKGDWRGDFWV